MSLFIIIAESLFLFVKLGAIQWGDAVVGWGVPVLQNSCTPLHLCHHHCICAAVTSFASVGSMQRDVDSRARC